MSKKEDELVEQLNKLLAKPGGRQAARYALSALGGVPFAGGALAGIGATWAEKEQHQFNLKITEWVKQADLEIDKVLELLADQLREPTKAHMALLVGEVTGMDLSEVQLPAQVPVILNGETVSEFQPYAKRGWLALTSNGNVSNMGAGNRIGNSIEDMKRPWGMGAGFILKILREYGED